MALLKMWLTCEGADEDVWRVVGGGDLRRMNGLACLFM